MYILIVCSCVTREWHEKFVQKFVCHTCVNVQVLIELYRSYGTAEFKLDIDMLVTIECLVKFIKSLVSCTQVHDLRIQCEP